MIIKSLILVTQCLFHLLQPGANGPPSCAVYISFSGTENIICFYNLSALPESLHLQGSSSSSPMSLFFLSFLLTAPRGGVGDSESQNGKWGSWNGETESRETPKRVARNHCLSPDLQMPWLQSRRENPLWFSVCGMEKYLSSNLMF